MLHEEKTKNSKTGKLHGQIYFQKVMLQVQTMKLGEEPEAEIPEEPTAMAQVRVDKELN